MKKFIFATLIAIFIIAAIPAQAEIPADKNYTIQLAAFSIALDVRAESVATANHYERLMLANSILSSPGAWANKIAIIAESAQYGTLLDWESITDTQIKNAMAGVWDDISIAMYGVAPVRPE